MKHPLKTLLKQTAIWLCLATMAHASGLPAWRGHAANAQHTAKAPTAGQRLANIHWTMSVDLAPSDIIHYASPMITAGNTVLVAVKTSAKGAFRLEAVKERSGKRIWTLKSDYIVPPHDWFPPLPAHLTAQNRLYFAGSGGTVFYRNSPDSRTGNAGRRAFYGIANYRAHKSAYDKMVMIDTPITADDQGNIYFGFLVTGSNPLHLKSGIARMDSHGNGTWISAGDAANDHEITEVAMNCAPAISADGSTVYITVSDGSTGYLVGLDSTTLAPRYRVRLDDPVSGEFADVSDNSSASPTIGPDGDVYYGVFENDENHNCRGWLLAFSADLATQNTPGSFGWDDTVAIVPARAVPQYHGAGKYYLMSKYNNYYGCGSGDGHNRIAILDPRATQHDKYSTATVMKEVETILDPHQVGGEPKGSVYEWCINTAVVDRKNQSVIANDEYGDSYQWDLATNSLSQTIRIGAPLGEAYTPTLIGGDGTVYAINDGILYAMGN